MLGNISYDDDYLKLVVEALDKLYSADEDLSLLERGCGERSLTFRLGVHIDNLLIQNEDGYVVDAEYNMKDGNPTKIILEECYFCSKRDCEMKSKRDLLKKWEEELRYADEINGNIRRWKVPYVYPDLIIHKRSTSDSDEVDNRIIIEIKTKDQSTGREKDDIKLKYFTCPDTGYKYKFGLFIDIGRKDYTINLYSGGQMVKEKWKL